MRVHRFYVGADIDLVGDFWMRDEALLWQWNKVLRVSEGQQVILFDGVKTDRLYEVARITKNEAHLHMKTELERKIPAKHIYLFWGLLKRDNNEYIIQKCTEIGVSNFVPLLTERTIKKDFNIERAHKIAVEAAEQSGRSTIPSIREPSHLEKALEEYADKIYFLVCRQGHKSKDNFEMKKYGLLIGPEGGWSESEQKIFSDRDLTNLGLSDFTLRAETAAIVASAKIL